MSPSSDGAGSTLADQRAHRLYALLDRVIDLTVDEREAVLAGCPEDLAAEVRAMLAEDEDGADDGFLETPPSFAFAPVETTPRQIGPYRILETLGEGGMARVFLAEQEEPVRRRVALKLLRIEATSRELQVRFEIERNAMGRLEHPNIGKILEGGTTDDGHPYFAMELVEGPPITAYCDEHQLDLEARLRLFAEVCRGVDHAHGKLLLHRDLKPSNILVAEVDGKPLPKIIDFGIAKSLEGALTDRTLATGGRLLGTPAYMSPEAIAGTDGELDVRSDVYALGVVLYELLTGSRPYQTANATLGAILKQITENDPKKPSTRVSSLEVDESAGLAAARRVDARTLSRRLEGDLDWVVMKALARDRRERYASAAELAAEIERYLNDEPVVARPPTAAYVLRKLARRHRTAAAAAGVALVAVLLGVLGIGIGLARAKRAEAKAVHEARVAVEARQDADRMVEFLVGILRGSGVDDPDSTKPPAERTALELLDAGAARIDRDFADQPAVAARLSYTVAGVYRELGQVETARQQAEKALALQLEDPAASARDIARTRVEIATDTLTADRPDEAKAQLEEALQLVPTGNDAETLSLRADIFDVLGRVERRLRDYPAAEAHLKQSVALFRTHPDLKRSDLARALNNLGTTYFSQRRWPEAEASFREAKKILDQVLPPGHVRRAGMNDNLAAALASQGKLEEAAPLFEQALAERRLRLPPDHPAFGDSLNNLGSLNLDLDRPEVAEGLLRESLAIREQALGPDNPKTAWSLDNLARAVGNQGRLAEAIALQERALAIREKALGPEDALVARSLEHLAELSRAAGDVTAAEAFEHRAARIRPSDPGNRTRAPE
ncbi:MAG: serine/threonine protein kinase [Acidobacteria bacterium]|nr:serine/threonine protein kinase [Acidobacteriota bacterium]